jgi:hypothetical protein
MLSLPPPLFYVGSLGLGLLLQRLVPLPVVPRQLRLPVGTALLALGILLMASGVRTMRRAGTPINPTTPRQMMVALPQIW